MELNLKALGIALISAVAGAGIMLLAVGGNEPKGLEGWVPVNAQVASAMSQEKADKKPEDQPGLKSMEQTKQEVGSTISSSKSKNEAKTQASSKEQLTTPLGNVDKQIHLNSATVQELMNIPGIGAKKAAAILAYREQHGAFQTINEVTQVKGIGNKMLEKMKPYIGL